MLPVLQRLGDAYGVTVSSWKLNSTRFLQFQKSRNFKSSGYYKSLKSFSEFSSSRLHCIVDLINFDNIRFY